jgi:hypothetical protein
MTPIEKLLALEEIKQLKAKYFRCVDTFDREGWLSVFTENAKLKYDSAIARITTGEVPAIKIEGKKAIGEYWDLGNSRLQTVHHGHMPEIEIISDTGARAVWAMEDIVDTPDILLHGYGHYWETYRKIDGKWLIDTLHLTRTRVSQVTKNRQTI